MQPKRWEQVQAALDEFQAYLSPAAPKLELQGALGQGVVLRDDHPRVLRRPGVYLFFDSSERLLLVGCSMSVMRNRVASHLTTPVYRLLPQSGWIDVIPLELRWYFLAPALEAYLICKCAPKHNRQLLVSCLDNEVRAVMQERYGISPE
jgi:hypothetical protein